jgi:hypothetical protein
MSKLSKSALTKLNALCEAAKARGWESFQGNSGAVGKTTQAYDDARGKVYDLLLQQQQRLKSLQAQSKQQPVIYAPGTKVRYNGSGNRSYQPKVGTVTFICQVSLDTGEVAYATLEGAWFAHIEFDWVADPTQESLQQVFKSIEDENEEEDEGY